MIDGTVGSQTRPASTPELRAALEDSLHLGVVKVDRRPSAYRSTFPLEELDVQLENGMLLELMFKDLSAPDEGASSAKPAVLYSPEREIDIYRRFLETAGLGTARCFGAVVDPPGERYWLFLERVRGVELYQVGDFDIWQRVAAWLAKMHLRSGGLGHCETSGRGIEYDARYFRRWLPRAREFHDAPWLSHLGDRYERNVEQLAALPRTLIHGEFYASNILVENTNVGLRVCPVDWEMTGSGSGLLDLAALIAGRWTEQEKRALALAYYGASHLSMSQGSFLAALQCCRLHLAIQWLGWSPSWTPPQEHRNDWIGEGERLVIELGL